MSKKTLLIVFLVLGFCVNISAQITLTLKDIQSFYTYGQKDLIYTNTVDATIDVGQQGATTWNYSGLQFQQPVDCNIMDPKQTAFWNDFHYHTSYVTLKAVESTKTTYQYFCHYANLKTHGSVEIYANDTSTAIKTYYEPAKIYTRLPLTINTTWKDTVAEKVIVITNGQTISSDSTQIITKAVADAYGTINLPNGETEEAVRIRMVEAHSSASGVDTVVVYRWFTATGATITASTNDITNGGQVQVNSNIIFFDTPALTGITDEQTAPVTFNLKQNYPNPFNPSTKIDYSTGDDSFVQLKVFNAIGKEVATLENSWKPAGNYSANFNASNLSSGIYFVKMAAGSFNKMMKITLMK